jgi:hypothetical protein
MADEAEGQKTIPMNYRCTVVDAKGRMKMPKAFSGHWAQTPSSYWIAPSLYPWRGLVAQQMTLLPFPDKIMTRIDVGSARGESLTEWVHRHVLTKEL